ncbi:discoidin domain-containing protein [Longispora sp. K20-0274]|uniref:discoidin domain-containing protein n=1 Tax=Longispora sp. K20-0274 TaxID=3088255 RepID=UPI00399C340D
MGVQLGVLRPVEHGPGQLVGHRGAGTVRGGQHDDREPRRPAGSAARGGGRGGGRRGRFRGRRAAGARPGPGRPAGLSSTATPAGAAVDGDTTNEATSQSQAQPYWQVDLGSAQPLREVELWNGATPGRLADFWILVSDTPITSPDLAAARAQAGVSSYPVTGAALRPSVVPAGRTGRYVRIQLAGTGALGVAEVKVR